MPSQEAPYPFSHEEMLALVTGPRANPMYAEAHMAPGRQGDPAAQSNPFMKPLPNKMDQMQRDFRWIEERGQAMGLPPEVVAAVKERRMGDYAASRNLAIDPRDVGRRGRLQSESQRMHEARAGGLSPDEAREQVGRAIAGEHRADMIDEGRRLKWPEDKPPAGHLYTPYAWDKL